MNHYSGREFTEEEKERIRKMDNPAPYKQVDSWKVIHYRNVRYADGSEGEWYVSVAPAGDSFRPNKVFDKKKQAKKFARKKAKECNGELLIEKKNGRLQDRRVYL